MDLIVIAGFLGSGKTSVLLHLARPLAAAGRRIAVIENEVGKVGIDDRVLAAEGLRVKELYSGCICCSLRTDLVQTLLELERTWNPDVVLLEPSGVAGPDQVLEALVGYGGEINRRQVAVVLDATRAALLQSGTIPLVERGIGVADLLLVNKCDAAAPAAATALTAWAQGLRPGATAFAISAHTGDGLDAVAAHLTAAVAHDALPTPTRRVRRRPAAAHPHPERTDASAATFAWRGQLTWPAPADAREVQAQLSDLLHQLAREVAPDTEALAGHIKAIVQVRPAGGYLLLSTTQTTQPPQPRGRLPATLHQAELTCNAILFGTTRPRLQRLFRKLLRRSPLYAAARRRARTEKTQRS
jgi:G3E family GTPase